MQVNFVNHLLNKFQGKNAVELYNCGRKLFFNHVKHVLTSLVKKLNTDSSDLKEQATPPIIAAIFSPHL